MGVGLGGGQGRAHCTTAGVGPGGGQGRDYLHASWIAIDGVPKTSYIAASAPLDEEGDRCTVGDFWRMIWQTQATTVVALANVEKGFIGCSKYWADRQWDEFNVKLLDETPSGASTVVRRLQLSKSDTADAPRIISQLHFKDWPNYGVPKDARPVAELAQIAAGSPLVVHCSGGVGRSGTFIAIHAEWQRMQREGGTTDVFGAVLDTVRSLRRRMDGRP